MKNIKEIISKFINLDVNEIKETTIIDKRAVKGSILIHRLYSELSSIGIDISDPKSITTYGDLIKQLNNEKNKEITKETNNLHSNQNNIDNTFIKGIGIDIEKISKLPMTADFRTDNFYIENFTSKEISHCILNENPYKSFASLFSLKEAIFKSKNSIFSSKKFNTIEITHNINGAPELNGFLLSTSYSDDTVVAVAISLI